MVFFITSFNLLIIFFNFNQKILHYMDIIVSIFNQAFFLFL